MKFSHFLLIYNKFFARSFIAYEIFLIRKLILAVMEVLSFSFRFNEKWGDQLIATISLSSTLIFTLYSSIGNF